MICVNRLDGTEFILNSDLIVTIERKPDTLLTLTTGARILVHEEPEEIVRRIALWRRMVLEGPLVDASAGS